MGESTVVFQGFLISRLDREGTEMAFLFAFGNANKS